MKRKGRFFLILTAAILIFSAVNTETVLASFLRKQRLTGSAAPHFSLETTQGTQEGFSGKEKGAVLFFFTTWCPYCREKMPFVAEEYRKKNAHIRIIPVDIGESKAKVVSYAEKMSLPFAILLDQDARVSQSYGVIGVPTIVLVDKEGNIIWTGNDIPGDYQKRIAGE